MQAVGTPWFTPEQWACLRKCADDPEIKGLSYDQWHGRSVESLKIFEELGIRVHKQHVDVREFVDWCVRHQQRLDADALCAFISRDAIGPKTHHMKVNRTTGKVSCRPVDSSLT